MNNYEYLIDLATRYKENKVSKSMRDKYFECTVNCIMFDISNMTFPDSGVHSLAFAGSVINYLRILNAPIPKFPEGGTAHGKEIITTPTGEIFTPKEPVVMLPKLSKETIDKLLKR